MRLKLFFTVFVLFVISSSNAFGQFEEPDIEKVSQKDRKEFMERFGAVNWTGQGFYSDTEIDRMDTQELRSRLQAVYGNPTQKLEDLIDRDDFRLGMAIQFEYWFTVDDSIPMMLLDVDGPFGRGFVYGGASRYIDLMPQVKRTLAQQLMGVEKLVEFRDYFYSPEREQWFDVRYEKGEFVVDQIKSPEGMTIN